MIISKSFLNSMAQFRKITMQSEQVIRYQTLYLQYIPILVLIYTIYSVTIPIIRRCIS